jgi:hypothetical protein
VVNCGLRVATCIMQCQSACLRRKPCSCNGVGSNIVSKQYAMCLL